MSKLTKCFWLWSTCSEDPSTPSSTTAASLSRSHSNSISLTKPPKESTSCTNATPRLSTEISRATMYCWIAGGAPAFRISESPSSLSSRKAQRRTTRSQLEPYLIFVDIFYYFLIVKDLLGSPRSVAWWKPIQAKRLYVLLTIISEFLFYSSGYSFGVTLYEIFHRADPYPTGDPLSIAYKVANHGLRPTIDPSIHPRISTLIQQCLAENPSKRPPFDDITRDLCDILMTGADDVIGKPTDNSTSCIVAAVRTFFIVFIVLIEL